MPSKKNAWKRASGGHVYIDKKMSSVLDDFLWQLRGAMGIHQKGKKHAQFPIVLPLELTVSFKTRRQKDLDNMVTTLMDLLQKSGVIKNDSQILKINATKGKAAIASVSLMLVDY